jgi:hypothetical protein
MSIVAQRFAGYREYMAAAHETLMTGRRARGAARQRVLAATGHALALTTWKSLATEQDLDDAQAADLMCRLIGASPTQPKSAANYPQARTGRQRI